jgi:hypothetical protein
VEDPIPAGFITLPEALQRLAARVSEAHLESAKLEFQERVLSFAANLQSIEQSATATNEPRKSELADNLALLGLPWDKRTFAISKLRLALQTGAISAIVRAPESGTLFRLTQNNWRFEPFWEQIIRGGIIPLNPGRGLEAHHGRTVIIEAAAFEAWLTLEVQNWSEGDKDQLCCKWLLVEMRSSPTERKKTKAQWREEARAKYRVSGRAFDKAWSRAVKETGSNWGLPGAPNKSSQ